MHASVFAPPPPASPGSLPSPHRGTAPAQHAGRVPRPRTAPARTAPGLHREATSAGEGRQARMHARAWVGEGVAESGRKRLNPLCMPAHQPGDTRQYTQRSRRTPAVQSLAVAALRPEHRAAYVGAALPMLQLQEAAGQVGLAADAQLAALQAAVACERACVGAVGRT